MQKKKLSEKVTIAEASRWVMAEIKKLEKENEELLAIVEQLFDGKSVIDMDLYTKIDSYLANKE